MIKHKRNSINIPAVLVHTVDDTEYRVSGHIVGINESNETVSMKFNGYKGIEHGIPMSSIYVNEGILDSIKNAGKKAIGTVKTLVRKVRGFLYLVINGKFEPNSLNAPVNLAVRAERGEIPGVSFYPSKNLQDFASENGIELTDDEPEFTIDDIEAREIENYWDRVMKEYTQDESVTIDKAIKNVNEKYYVDKFKKYGRKHLNEASLSLKNHPGFPDKYGMEVDLETLKGRIMTNVLAQISRGPGEPIGKFRPYIIWGAPGIGKTACLTLLAKDIKRDTGVNLSLEIVQCSGLNRDDWGLPAKEENDIEFLNNKITHSFATGLPINWLPVYKRSNDPEQNQYWEDFFASGAYRGDGSNFDGGILFFDELSRLPKPAKSLMMALVDKGMYQNMYLASKWALVFASNRYEDVFTKGEADLAEFIWEDAQDRRYNHLTFVPDKNDWLEWARGRNADGIQNIQEKYCKFIEIMPEKVWYPTIENGGFDTYLTDDDKAIIMDYLSASKTDTIDKRDALEGMITSKMGFENKLTVSLAAWESISAELISELKYNLFFMHPELLKMCIINRNIDENKLAQALDMLSPSEWDAYYKRNKKIIDPSGVLKNNRIQFFREVEQKLIMQKSFGEDSAAMQEWSNYNSYKRIFTPELIANLWNTGNMLVPEIQKDDDKYFPSVGEYRKTEYSKWKANTQVAHDVIDLIFSNFPGGYQAAVDMIKDEAVKVSSIQPIDDMEMDKLIKKYNKAYTITIDKQSVTPFLIGSVPAKDKEKYRAMVTALDNSKFARMLANIATYFTKVKIQMGQGGGDIIKYVKEYLRAGSGLFFQELYKIDPEVEELLFPTEASIKVKDRAKKDLLFFKSIGYPGLHIVLNADGIEKKIATGKI